MPRLPGRDWPPRDGNQGWLALWAAFDSYVALTGLCPGRNLTAYWMNVQRDQHGLAGGPEQAKTNRAKAVLADAPVIVVSHGFQPNYERGFVNGLASNGVQVTLVSSDRTDVAGLMPAVAAVNLRGSQDASRTVLSKALNLLGYHLRLMWLTLTRRQALVHVTGLLDPVLWCGVLQGLWFRGFSAHYVLTVHNVLPHDRHSALNQRLYRLAYRLPHALVVHTPAMKHQLVQAFRILPARVHVMEHGIEPLGPVPTGLPPARREGPLRLLFFGALMRYKGLDVLLQALAEDLPPFELTIAGPCVDTTLARDLEQMIAAHPHRARIHWRRGYVAEEVVPALMLDADVLVLPYRHIDQSGVLFQALRYGLPVVATDVGSFRHYVSGAVGEICEPANAAALAAALRRYGQRRPTFSRPAIRELAREFEWPLVTRVLSGAYGVSRGRGEH